MSAAEAELALQLRAQRYWFEQQYRFHPTRRFRADFAVWTGSGTHPLHPRPLLVEVDGAKRGKPGAHQRVDGIDYDCRRNAEAMVLGYRLLRVSSKMVKDGTALQYIEALLEEKDGKDRSQG